MPVKEGWTDITDRLELENTFGRHVVVKDVPGEKHPFMRMAVPDGVQVLGLDEYGRVIVITETRKDTGEVYSHLVGGTVEDGESPEKTAEREFLEETGYKVGNLIPLGTLHKDSAHLQGATFAFLATRCTKVQEPEDGVNVTFMTPDAFEQTLYEYVSADFKKPRGGGNSVITLWLARNWLKARKEGN